MRDLEGLKQIEDSLEELRASGLFKKVERLERTNAALLAACKIGKETLEWIQYNVVDATEPLPMERGWNEEIYQMGNVIADAEKPE